MSAATEILRREDEIAGRVIPRWRYNLAYALVFVSIMLAHVVPDGFWWSALSFAPGLGAMTFGIDRFKRRTITG